MVNWVARSNQGFDLGRWPMAMDMSKLGRGVMIAEAERDKRRHEGFMADLFRGRANFELFASCQNFETADEKREGEKMLAKLRHFLMTEVDPQNVEDTDRISNRAMEWLCEEGFFGLKIPVEYGGKNLSQSDYMRLMSLTASYCGALVALLSASNSIGLSWPLKGYGTDEQKKKYLPKVASSPSGFSFTEAGAGSDPANMETVAVRIKDESGVVTGYHITGKKWWMTNGAKNDSECVSPLICLIVKTVDKPEEIHEKGYKPCFSAFIIPTNSEGISWERCQFEGLRGMYNSEITYNNVHVPKEQLVGEKEGLGFKIAMEALNTGRLAVAGSCAAISRQCLLIGKWWGNERRQWGKQIGKHEAVGSGMLAPGLADAFAMEAMCWYATYRVDHKLDARMEAAACKVYASERGWKIVDDLMQMRGGRGYETAKSLENRGEPPIPTEAIHRNFRPNRIFEGSSEILSQWIIREGIDEYKKRGEVFLEKGQWLSKLGAALGFGWDLLRLTFRRKTDTQIHTRSMKKHLNFVDSMARKLAKTVIWSSAKYRAKLPHKQLLFMRLANIAPELYAMSAACFYANELNMADALQQNPNKHRFIHLANYYCAEARLRIEGWFHEIRRNNDDKARKIAENLLGGNYDDWLKKDIISIVDQLGLDKSKSDREAYLASEKLEKM